MEAWSSRTAARDPSSGDWRSDLTPEARHRIVNKIMDSLNMLVPSCGPEVLNELNRMAVQFEEKTYTAATSQYDYIRKIAIRQVSIMAKIPGNQSLDESDDVGIQPLTPPCREYSSLRCFRTAEPNDTVM